MSAATKVIHILVSRIGMTDDQYRQMLGDRYGVSSSLQLSGEQAADLVVILNSLLPEATRSSKPGVFAGTRLRYEELGVREGMATPRQLRMLEAAFSSRSRADTLEAKQQAFRSWLKKRDIASPAWIPEGSVGKLLRAINNIRKDAEPRAGKAQNTNKRGANHGQD